jgi:hypothetical protein
MISDDHIVSTVDDKTIPGSTRRKNSGIDRLCANSTDAIAVSKKSYRYVHLSYLFLHRFLVTSRLLSMLAEEQNPEV